MKKSNLRTPPHRRAAKLQLRLASAAAFAAVLGASFSVMAQPVLPVAQTSGQLGLGQAGPVVPAPPRSAPGTPPPVAKTADQGPGVPFPSMRPGAKPPEIPLSTEKMDLDQSSVDTKMRRALQQSDTRVQELVAGNGHLDSPDISAHRGDLLEMSDLQFQSRLLDARQAVADKTMKYWATVHDNKREEEARIAAAAAAVAPAAPPATIATAPAPLPLGAHGVSVQDGTQDKSDQIVPFAKVVSIIGTGDSLKAILLVPYVGEVKATIGTVLPGNRRVSRISADGVYVSDPKNGTVALGFGDSVPLLPTAVATSGTSLPARAPLPGGTMGLPAAPPVH